MRGARSVTSLQAHLDRLNRELEREIADRDRAPWETRSTAFDSLLEILRELFDQVDRIRGSERADEFGLDPAFEELVAPFFVFLYRKWWRVDVEGIENVPATGSALLVGNHAGAMFPWDGAMLKVALRLDHPAERELRPLIENFVYHMPFVGSFMARTGGVRACPENAERLLRRGETVVVFPEGLRGIGKTFRERYRLQRFGRGGFVTLCLRTGAPIVPVAIIGAEEIHPLLGKLTWPAKLVGLPYLPITPTFPWLGVFGLVPFPTKWTIRFGAPIDIGARFGPDRAEDALLVDRLTFEVQNRIQEMLEESLRARRSVFF
jgi:1-acyl-sn-glycerol-3-phosphate acyltransferase